MTVSLNHTLQVLHMKEAFYSHFNSSQVDEISVALSYRELRIQNWTVVPFVFNITPLHGRHGKHRSALLWMHVYRCINWKHTSYISVYLLGADRIEKSLTSFVARIRFHKAVDWQRVDMFSSSVHLWRRCSMSVDQSWNDHQRTETKSTEKSARQCRYRARSTSERYDMPVFFKTFRP
jgi:hypothetical protein